MGLTTTIQIKLIFLLTLWKQLSRSAVNHGEWFVELNILVQQVDKETQLQWALPEASSIFPACRGSLAGF